MIVLFSADDLKIIHSKASTDFIEKGDSYTKLNQEVVDTSDVEIYHFSSKVSERLQRISSIPHPYQIHQNLSNNSFLHFTYPTLITDINVYNDNIWFAFGTGVLRYSKQESKWFVYTASDGLIHQQDASNFLIDVIVVYNQKIYAVNEKPPYAFEFIDQESKWRKVPPTHDNYGLILSLAEQRRKRKYDIYMNENLGIKKFKEYAETLLYPVSCILETDTEIWFAGGGICRFVKKNRKWNWWKIIDNDANYVTSIANTGTSIWFGTKSGLTEYNKDINQWHRYTTDDGLVDNSIEYIYSTDNCLWIGTNRGINSFNWKTGERREYIFDSEISINSFVVGDDFKAYIATEEGLKIYNLTTEVWENTDVPPILASRRVTSVVKMGNALWFATDLGLFSFENKFWVRWLYNINQHTWLGDTLPISIAEPLEEFCCVINCLRTDGDEIFTAISVYWESHCGCEPPFEGFFKYDSKTKKWESLDINKPKVSDIRTAEIDEEYYWLSTKDTLWRINRYDFSKTEPIQLTKYVKEDDRRNIPNAWLIQINQCLPHEINAFCVDKEIIWCGTTRGISAYDIYSSAWRSFVRSCYNCYIPEQIIVGNDRYIWVQTSYRDIRVATPWARFDKAKNVWEYINYYDTDYWNATSGSPVLFNDKLFWGSSDGYRMIDIETLVMEYHPMGERVWNVLPTLQYIWILTETRIGRYDIRKKIWKFYDYEKEKIGKDFNDNTPFCFTLDEPYIWFAGRNGLARFDLQNEKVEYLNIPVYNKEIKKKCYLNIGISYIFPDKENVWLISPRTCNTIIRYDKKNNLFQEIIWPYLGVILCAASDKDYLYLSANYGLTIYDKNTGIFIICNKIADLDIFIPPRPTYIAIDNSYLWIGDMGITKMDLKKFKHIIKNAISKRLKEATDINREKIKEKLKEDQIIQIEFSEPMKFVECYVGNVVCPFNAKKTSKYPFEIWTCTIPQEILNLMAPDDEIRIYGEDLANNPLMIEENEFYSNRDSEGRFLGRGGVLRLKLDRK
ncbi:MAG: hypothetical protein ABIL66_06350 [candidate division WOR-3 bacterium]